MLEIEYIKSIASTHLFVIDALKKNKINPPYALYADEQNGGVGSRGNVWSGAKGNLYLSLCVDRSLIADDVPSPSISIYFASILKEMLASYGSKVWLKWPNDFYINEKKIGGIITAKIGEVYVVSVGINLLYAPDGFEVLDIKMKNSHIVERFCQEIKKIFSWKQVFSSFRVEFQKSRKFAFHKDDKIVSLEDAVLNNDGSIQIKNKKVYSLR